MFNKKNVEVEFQGRIQAFNDDLNKLQEKYEVMLYAVYCINKTGELLPQMKLMNRKVIEQVSTVPEKSKGKEIKKGENDN